MRIGIDGLHLFGNYSGIQHSLANLVTALRENFPQDEVFLHVPRDFQGPPQANGDSGLAIKRAFFPGRWRSIRTLWRSFMLQRKLYAEKCDVMHGPSYALPAAVSMPAVVTIHDVIALTHPLFCTPGSARVQKRLIPRSVGAARRVIVPSLAAKEEILRNIKGTSPEKIDVVPWGVGTEFKPVAEREKVREQLKLPERYVLFVGNIEPKKNIPTLIQAFFAAKMNKRLPHKLVIAGQKGWGVENLERLIRHHMATDYVLFTGYVEQAALPAMYSLADLFVMPSIVEGFGMPALEAMACGCPVVVSADAALQEVCGSAARIVPYHESKPLQPLREAIEDILLTGSAERQTIAERGIERAKLFTWEKTARLTRASYEQALK